MTAVGHFAATILALLLCLAIGGCAEDGGRDLKAVCKKMAECGWISEDGTDAYVEDGKARLSSSQKSCVKSCSPKKECHAYLDCLVDCN